MEVSAGVVATAGAGVSRGEDVFATGASSATGGTDISDAVSATATGEGEGATGVGMVSTLDADTPESRQGEKYRIAPARRTNPTMAPSRKIQQNMREYFVMTEPTLLFLSGKSIRS